MPTGNLSDYTHLEIEVDAPLGNRTRTIVVYLDDVSLEEVSCAGGSVGFPNAISLNEKTINTLGMTGLNHFDSTTVNTDTLIATFKNHHHFPRVVETDGSGNTYVAAQVIWDQPGFWIDQFNSSVTYKVNGSNTVRNMKSYSGIILSKYNLCGGLEWQSLIYNKNNCFLVDMEVENNGDISLIGNARVTNANFHDLVYDGPSQHQQALSVGLNTFRYKIDKDGNQIHLNHLPGFRAVDASRSGGRTFILMENTSSQQYLVREPSNSQSIYNTRVLLTQGHMGLKVASSSNSIFVAKRGSIFLNIEKYSFTGALLQSSMAMRKDGTVQVVDNFISDMACSPNGEVYIVGNFQGGIGFENNVPTSVTANTVYQDYTGGGVTGFIAKYDGNLNFVSKDFLRPQVAPGGMVPVTTVISSTPSCTPHDPANCDILTTEITHLCPNNGGLTYFCSLTSTVMQYSPAVYTGSQDFTAKYHDITFDNSGDVFVSGILNNVEWGPGVIVSANQQHMIVKYNSSLSRQWINHTSGSTGIENTALGKTTSTAFNSVSGKLSYVGNFIGPNKQFDQSSLSSLGSQEHIFVTDIEDLGISSVFKNNGALDVAEMEDVKNKIDVYPNPALSEVFVSGLDGGIASVELWNSSGKLILRRELKDGEPLSLSNLKRGLYVMKVKVENSLFTEKLVIE